MKKHLFVFGMGYSAQELARRLLAEGWMVSGTVRSDEKGMALHRTGIRAWRFNDETLLPAAALDGVTHVIDSVPPEMAGDPVFDRHRERLYVLPGLEWFAYLSTTGVYGDTQGEWVDESAPTPPTQTRSQRRIDAEQAWLGLHREFGLPVHIFRIAGIYGPGRSAIDALRAGRAHRAVKPGHVTSRIHRDDIAGILRASIARPNPGAIYNVCDDEPAPPQDVVTFAAQLIGVTPPPEIPFEQADLSPMARSFYDSNRRVSNRRIHDELGYRLLYPTYREGLAAIAAQTSSTA